MGFWTFGGGKKQEGPQPSYGQSGNASQLEKVRAETYMSSRQNTTDIKTRARTTSVPQPPRSHTAPVLTESRSAQNVRSGVRQKDNGFYQHTPTSQVSLGAENLPAFSGPPTLFAKRADRGAQSPRPKSSKRKADQYAREQEIRAMASSPIPIPKRPANFRSESPLLREKRQITGVLKRHSSEISLPLPGALSNIDFTSSQNSFKIGMFAALSPRPNIQYDSQARSPSGKQPVRAGLAIQKAIEEEDVSELKRIDELADDLDAGALRELMERDRKRREKKKEVDKERLLRKLERRAIKDREEETRRARTEAYVRESSPANAERRRGRKADTSASRSQKGAKKSTTQKRPAKDTTKEKDDIERRGKSEIKPETKDPFADDADTSKADARSTVEAQKDPFADKADIVSTTVLAPIRNPFEDEAEIPLTPRTDAAAEEATETELPLRSPLRPVGEKLSTAPAESQPAAPPPVVSKQQSGRSSLSQRSISALNRVTRSDKTEDSGHEKKASGSNNVRLSTWTNFFSTGTRRKLATPTHGSKPPPEFSATSREADQRKALPPVVTDRTFRRSSSGTPQRTLSRFREDLPELPISQPSTQVQSPVSIASPVRILDVSQQRIIDDEDDDAYSIQQSLDIESRPTSTTAAPLPQSMASVDSEGSWLSGRPTKRVSATSGPTNTVQRSQKDHSGDVSAQDEPLDDNDDTRQPVPGDTNVTSVTSDLDDRAQTPELPPKSDMRKSIHADARRRPTLVSQEDRIQSQAGLLNEADAEDAGSKVNFVDDNDGESPGSVEIIEAPLLRAQSVEYRGHARAVSAGSAKLLDIRRISTHSDLSQPRSSTNQRKSGLGFEQQDDSVPSTPVSID